MELAPKILFPSCEQFNCLVLNVGFLFNLKLSDEPSQLQRSPHRNRSRWGRRSWHSASNVPALWWLVMKMECLCFGVKPWSSFDRWNQDYHTWISSDFFGIIQHCRLLLTRLVHCVTKSTVQFSLLFEQKVHVPCLESTSGANSTGLYSIACCIDALLVLHIRMQRFHLLDASVVNLFFLKKSLAGSSYLYFRRSFLFLSRSHYS